MLKNTGILWGKQTEKMDNKGKTKRNRGILQEYKMKTVICRSKRKKSWGLIKLRRMVRIRVIFKLRKLSCS